MPAEPFALAINCVDGRVQEPLLRWIREELSLSRVDYLTVPGADAALAEPGPELDRARRTASFLADERDHGCALVAGHWDCLGNAVDEDRHREQIRRAAEELHGWGVAPRTLGVWITDGWGVEVVTELASGGEAEGARG